MDIKQEHEDRSSSRGVPGDWWTVKKTVENVLLKLSSILRTAKAWDYACGNFSFMDSTMPREGVKNLKSRYRQGGEAALAQSTFPANCSLLGT
jgi:hypothetical protein